MSARKQRIHVVLDTNVFVRNFKSRSKSSANRKIIRLWLLEKRLQLVVSPEVVAEYLEIFAEILEMDLQTIQEWRKRFVDDPRVTTVKTGRPYKESRDPDDNVFLSAARAGNAKYLISNDRDLLDIPEPIQRTLPFLIVRPDEFLAALGEET